MCVCYPAMYRLVDIILTVLLQGTKEVYESENNLQMGGRRVCVPGKIQHGKCYKAGP